MRRAKRIYPMVSRVPIGIAPQIVAWKRKLQKNLRNCASLIQNTRNENESHIPAACSIRQPFQPLLSDRSLPISLAPPAPLSFPSEGVRSTNPQLPTLNCHFERFLAMNLLLNPPKLVLHEKQILRRLRSQRRQRRSSK
jgi:hypothetical protein